MIPLSCSIAGEGRVKWLSYEKSKGESIRCCPGETHTEQEDKDLQALAVKDHSTSQ